MRIGVALIVIAIGAILDFAVTVKNRTIDIQTIGLIVMLAGIAGLLFELYAMFRRRTYVIREQQVANQYPAPPRAMPYADPYAEPYPPQRPVDPYGAPPTRPYPTAPGDGIDRRY